jgi:hypothetical protein
MMFDAAQIIGIGVSLFGFGVAVHLGIDGWIRYKRFERENQLLPPPPPANDALAARLARIEQIVETTAVEVERVAEAQRYLARSQAEQGGTPPARLPEPRPTGRVVTPH